MRARLHPETDRDISTFRKAIQTCLDRLQSGADYRIWESILRNLGTKWLERSPEHDVQIL